jgi:hypothetical protein
VQSLDSGQASELGPPVVAASVSRRMVSRGGGEVVVVDVEGDNSVRSSNDAAMARRDSARSAGQVHRHRIAAGGPCSDRWSAGADGLE